MYNNTEVIQYDGRTVTLACMGNCQHQEQLLNLTCGSLKTGSRTPPNSKGTLTDIWFQTMNNEYLHFLNRNFRIQTQFPASFIMLQLINEKVNITNINQAHNSYKQYKIKNKANTDP